MGLLSIAIWLPVAFGALLLALGASARLTTSRYDGTALIAAAHLGQVRLFEQGQHLGEGLRPKVPRVVVGQRHGIKVTLQDRNDARMGSKGVHLVARRPV